MGRSILRNIVDIFADVVSAMVRDIEVNSVSNVGNVYTFNVDKTYWTRPKSQKSLATKVTIDSTIYDVDAVVYNESITVTSTSDLSDTTTLRIAAPYYINGTQYSTQKKRTDKDSFNICPFVWLVEPFTAIENEDRLSAIASEPDLVVLFLDNINPNDWETPEKYSKVVQPMDELVNAFFEEIRNFRSLFGKVTNKRVIRHAIFGKEGEAGKIHQILNEKTGGVEVRFSVRIFKQYCT